MFENWRRASFDCWTWRRHVRGGAAALVANVRAAMRVVGLLFSAVAMRAVHLLGAAIVCVRERGSVMIVVMRELFGELHHPVARATSNDISTTRLGLPYAVHQHRTTQLNSTNGTQH